MRTLFGWDLPPGCTQRHIDEAAGVYDDPCECCGRQAEDCICPECFNCGEQGNPACYEEGHHSDNVRLNIKLEYSPEQMIGRCRLRISRLEEQIVGEQQMIAYYEEQIRHKAETGE